MAKYKTSNNEFEAWCLNKVHPGHINTLKVTEIFDSHRKRTSDLEEAKDLTIEEIRNAGEQHEPVNLHVQSFGNLKSFDLSHFHSPKTERIDEDSRSNYWDLISSQDTQVSFGSAIIRNFRINGSGQDAKISDCFIERLSVGGDSNILTLTDCFVGTLVIQSACLSGLMVTGGTIRAVECPASDADNPFTGSVTFTNVDWPTRRSQSRLFEGPQQFRNLRAHMRKLENVPETANMRALELASEREADTGTNFIVSWLYGAISDYGRSPAKPFFLAVGLYLFMAGAVYVGDATQLGLKDLEIYVGWRSALLNSDSARAFFLPLQSMINPGGIFGAKILVVAANGWWQTATVIQGLFCDLFLAMSAFAIRKRFKVQ